MTVETAASLIVHKEKIDSWVAHRRVPQAGHCIVYTDPDGRAVTVEGNLTAGEQAYRRVSWVYEVDVTPRTLEFRTTLPTQGDAFVFSARVAATWVVRDPAQVVTTGGVDGAALVRAFLEAEMPRISRRHHVVKAEAAEEEIRARLAHQPVELGYGIGLAGLTVRIELDGEAKAAAAAAVKEGWAADRMAAGHAANVLKTQHNGEINTIRQQQAQELKDAQAAHLQKLADREAEHQQALDRQREQLQLEFDRQRQEHNRMVLERDGLVGALSAHLTAHPEATADVLKVMTDRLDRDNDFVRSMVQLGIDKEMLEEHQLAGLMEAATDRVSSQLGSPGTRPARAPDAVAPGPAVAALEQPAAEEPAPRGDPDER